MPGLLMIAGFIMLGPFAMMMRGALVMLATPVRDAYVAVLLFGCTEGGETASEL
jgi:uncharacterized membrane protein